METYSSPQPVQLLSGETLLQGLLTGELTDPAKYDGDIVQLLKKHLSGTSIRSRAGQELADDLVALAQQRAIKARSQ